MALYCIFHLFEPARELFAGNAKIKFWIIHEVHSLFGFILLETREWKFDNFLYS